MLGTVSTILDSSTGSLLAWKPFGKGQLLLELELVLVPAAVAAAAVTVLSDLSVSALASCA